MADKYSRMDAKRRSIEKRKEIRKRRQERAFSKEKTIEYPDGTKRVFSNKPVRGRIGAPGNFGDPVPSKRPSKPRVASAIARKQNFTKPKANEESPSTQPKPVVKTVAPKPVKTPTSKPVAKASVAVAPAKPAEAAGATTKSGKSENTYDSIKKVVGGAAGAYALERGRQIRKKVRGKVVSKALGAAQGAITATEEKPKTKLVKAAKASTSASKPQKSGGGIVTPKAKVVKSAPAGIGPGKASRPGKERNLKVPASIAKPVQQGAKETPTAKVAGIKAEIAKLKRENAAIKARTGNTPKVAGAKAAAEPASQPTTVLRKKGSEQKATARIAKAKPPTKGVTPQPDVNSPVRAKESPSVAGIDRTVAGKKPTRTVKPPKKGKVQVVTKRRTPTVAGPSPKPKTPKADTTSVVKAASKPATVRATGAEAYPGQKDVLKEVAELKAQQAAEGAKPKKVELYAPKTRTTDVGSGAGTYEAKTRVDKLAARKAAIEAHIKKKGKSVVTYTQEEGTKVTKVSGSESKPVLKKKAVTGGTKAKVAAKRVLKKKPKPPKVDTAKYVAARGSVALKGKALDDAVKAVGKRSPVRATTNLGDALRRASSIAKKGTKGLGPIGS